jgi:hypothetical protein
MFHSITVRAGSRALAILRDEGLRPDRIGVLAGASGGPKWLVLAGMDRVLPRLFRKRKKPLFLLGSSIGSWRMAALAQKNPLRAVEAFEYAYINQRYSNKPDIREVTRESFRVMDAYVNGDAIRHILAHPFMRMSLLADRSRFFGGSDALLLQGAHVALAALANLASRRMLKYFFERALFYDAREAPPFSGMDDFPMAKTPLSEKNFRTALMASGSIPLVMEGMTNIPGAPAGTYRDGGIIDYHLDVPFNVPEGELVLYPHFYDYIVPGWFDKSLRWRNPSPRYMESVVLVSPSAEFVKDLPLGKIPDREDFRRFKGRDAERIRCWEETARRSRVMGEEFVESVESGRIRDIVLPLRKR